jgi:hypothetical protein
MLGIQKSVSRLADVKVREGGVPLHQRKLGSAGRAQGISGSAVSAAQSPRALHSHKSLFAWTREEKGRVECG